MQTTITEHVGTVVAAFVSKNPIPASDLPQIITDVHATLERLRLGKAPVQEESEQTPAAPIKKSINRDFIICLEDGLKFKSLKRHLSEKYGMTPNAYREKWGLPKDYPMVAPSYSEQRSALAKQAGLGLRPATAAAASKEKRSAKART